jgi:hypothetical protein
MIGQIQRLGSLQKNRMSEREKQETNQRTNETKERNRGRKSGGARKESTREADIYHSPLHY